MTENIIKIESTEPCNPLKRALYWLQAVEFQACRVLTINAAPFSEHTHLRMEIHFLLIALEKSRRWLTVIENKVSSTELTEQIKIFLSDTTTVKDLRDIWEHDDEYDMGNGRFRSKIHHRYKSGADILEVDYSMLSTSRKNGLPIGNLNNWDGLQVLLGGRLDIVFVRTATLNLAKLIIDITNLSEQ